jgi:hypothetical protein
MYKDYLKTYHWMTTKTRTYRKFKKCFFCGSRENLNIHHRRYVSKKGKNILFKEQQGDLIVLCKNCHNIWHDIVGKNVYKFRIYKLIQHFIRNDKMEIIPAIKLVIKI